VKDAPDKNVNTLSARTYRRLLSVLSVSEPPVLMRILIGNDKPKPIPPVDTMVKVPEMVSVLISTSSKVPVKVTVKPVGISMEHLPDGTTPDAQVATSSNAPDCFAVNVVIVLLGVVVVSLVPGVVELVETCPVLETPTKNGIDNDPLKLSPSPTVAPVVGSNTRKNVDTLLTNLAPPKRLKLLPNGTKIPPVPPVVSSMVPLAFSVALNLNRKPALEPAEPSANVASAAISIVLN